MTPKRKTRAGIIGAGGISQVAHIPNLSTEEGVEIVALSDIDPTRAAMVAKRFRIPKWYDEPEEMLRRTELDCVFITTPTISHLPLCRFALESGADVFVEKPFARNVSEARQIVETAEREKRIVMVAMNHRFREDSAHLKKLVQNGELGDILTIRSGWLKRLGVWGRPYWFTDPKLAGGGALMDLGLQMIDLALFIVSFIPMVEAVGSHSNKILGLQVEDTASAFIRLADDIAFQLDVSWANCAQEDIAYTIFTGSQGSASLNPLRLVRRQRDRVMNMTPPGLGNQIQLYRQSFRTEISHFINCVQRRTTPLSNGREAVAVLEVIERLYKSAGR
jgi:predicted dehydrogenase